MSPSKENAMLVDIQYVRANRANNTPDYLYIIWKNLDTDEKYLQKIPEPKMDIYFEKPELRTHSYNKTYEFIKNLDKRTVKYKDIIYAIAEEAGEAGKRFLNNAFQTRDYKKLNEILLYPYVFGADYDPVAWYRIQWLRKLNNDRIKPLRKAFMDIEVDGYDYNGMPSAQTCPINAITLIDESTKDVYTFILTDRPYKPRRYASNPEVQKEEEYKRRVMYENMHEQQHYLQSHTEELNQELQDTFGEDYPDLKYHQYFYTDERKMIVHYFQLLHKIKPDICGVWNISFDIPYIIERCRALGMPPEEVMCHPDFPVKECRFKADTWHHEIKNKNDVFYLSGYTVFVDQMELYANIRKGQSELRGFKLNNIAEAELGDTKIEYSEEADIKTLPYINFKKFIIYNIKDVLLQYGIEQRVTDFDTLYVTSYENATEYQKTSMQTVKLRNVQYMFYLDQGLVPGSNMNVNNPDRKRKKLERDDDEEEDDAFEGALVGDPIYNDYVGVELYGRKTNNVFNNAIDFDMGAFYPNTIMAMNIDPSCLIFKANMDIRQYDFMGGKLKFRGITKNQFDSETTDAGKEFFDNMQTGNYMSTAYKWLNAPDVTKVYRELLKRRKKEAVA